MACRLGMQAAHRVGRRRDARFGGIRGSRRRSVWSRCNGCVARPTLRRTTLHSAVAAASGSLLLRFRPASCCVYLRMRTTLISCAAVLTLGCGEPAGPHSTSHTLSITASETWTLAESPHVVHGRLSVRGTLTIEAGATVLFADTSGLTFGKDEAGTLRAGETARLPLAGTFGGIDTSQVRLTHDTLRDSLTWARDIPWTVLEPVLIEGPHQPVLTIPAGATLLMKGGFIVGRNAPGGLQIGTEGGPTVTLRPVDESWGGVDFLPYAISSAISDALLDHCGANIERSEEHTSELQS